MSEAEAAVAESPVPQPDEAKAFGFRESMAERAGLPLAVAALLAAAFFLFDSIRIIVLVAAEQGEALATTAMLVGKGRFVAWYAGEDVPGWVYHDATVYGAEALGVTLAVVLALAALAFASTGRAGILLGVAAFMAASLLIFNAVHEIVVTAMWESAPPGWVVHEATYYGTGALGIALAMALALAAVAFFSAERARIPLTLTALLAAALLLFAGIHLIVFVEVASSGEDVPGWTWHSATHHGSAALGVALAASLVSTAAVLFLTAGGRDQPPPPADAGPDR